MRLWEPGDIPAAFGLLTRLPVRVETARAQTRGAAAAWAWPLVGAAVGLIGGATGWVVLGLGAGPAAGLALGAGALLTGAMHEDGLADTADGLWGGWTVARRLEIMKDSRIGTYGVLALVLISLLRWQAVVGLFEAGAVFGPLVVAGAVSRAPMAVLMWALPNARGGGLAQTVGRPLAITVTLGCGIAGSLAVLVAGWAGVFALSAVGGVAIAVALLAMAKIGGQTGDILGAAQVLGEVAALLVLLGCA